MNATELLIHPEPTMPAPTPLPNILPKVEALTPEMLPEAIRAYIFDVADRQQSPPDFVAVAAICGLAALVGRKVLIRPKQFDTDWTVTPNQWGTIIGRPSAMKSPSMKEALKPLNQIEAEAAEHYDTENKRHKAEKELAALEKDDIKSKAKQMAKKGNREGALQALEQTDFNEPPPTRYRLVVNDPSVEKLGELLNENPNGLILVRDELSGWLAKLGKEEYQGDRAFYLECFDGNGRYVYDRIGRGTIEIKNCTLSVIGGIQPAKIGFLVREAICGTADDGLVQRLQLAVWPDDIGNWQWKDRAPDIKARAIYRDTFTRLHSLIFKTDEGEPCCLHFTPEAQGLFIQWMEQIQTTARTDGLHPAIESHLLKMPQTIARLALLFELIDGGQDAVGKTAIARALLWAAYLKSHAERLYSTAANDGVENAHLILKRKNKIETPFTARDIQRKCWAGLDEITAVNKALECLIDHNYLKPVEVPPSMSGGRPTINHYWNPQYHKGNTTFAEKTNKAPEVNLTKLT